MKTPNSKNKTLTSVVSLQIFPSKPIIMLWWQMHWNIFVIFKIWRWYENDFHYLFQVCIKIAFCLIFKLSDASASKIELSGLKNPFFQFWTLSCSDVWCISNPSKHVCGLSCPTCCKRACGASRSTVRCGRSWPSRCHHRPWWWTTAGATWPSTARHARLWNHHSQL